MKISMSLLARSLQAYSPEIHILDDRCTIGGIRFLSAQYRRSSLDYVYLGAAEDYFQDPKYADALLLANGQNQIICHGADYEELLNAVLAAFDSYNAIDQSLYSAAADHLPLGEMMHAPEAVVGGSVLVFDMVGKLLASTHLELLPESDSIVQIRKTGRMSLNSIAQRIVDAHGNPIHDLTDRAKLSFVKGEEGSGCVCRYLTLDGERVGFLMIFPADELDCLGALALGDRLSDYFCQAAEYTGSSSDSRAGRSIVQDLLEGRIPDEAQIRRVEAGMAGADGYTVLTFRSHNIQNYTFRTMFRESLERELENCFVCVLENCTAVLCRSQDVEMIREVVMRNFRERNVSVGISMTVSSLQDLNGALNQAQFAMDASTEPGVRYCRDLAMPFLLRTLGENPMAMNLLHPVIGRLLRYDEENGTEMLRTLDGYLHCGCRQKDAAEYLHIHLNTLKYRLRRIGELGGVNLEDPDEVFYLRISVELDRLRR